MAEYVSPVTGTIAGKGSSPYGATRSGGSRQHSGVDFQAKNGSPAVAVIGGRVIYVGDNQGYDENVVVLGDDGNAYRYATHGPLSVVVGDTVAQGGRLGVIGRGHLHFEIIRAGTGLVRQMVDRVGQFVSTRWPAGTTAPTIDPVKFFGASTGGRVDVGAPLGTVAPTPSVEVPNVPTGELIPSGPESNDPFYLGDVLKAAMGGSDADVAKATARTASLVKAASIGEKFAAAALLPKYAQTLKNEVPQAFDALQNDATVRALIPDDFLGRIDKAIESVPALPSRAASGELITPRNELTPPLPRPSPQRSILDNIVSPADPRGGSAVQAGIDFGAPGVQPPPSAATPRFRPTIAAQTSPDFDATFGTARPSQFRPDFNATFGTPPQFAQGALPYSVVAPPATIGGARVPQPNLRPSPTISTAGLPRDAQGRLVAPSPTELFPGQAPSFQASPAPSRAPPATSAQVRTTQQFLADNGFNPGPIDGIYGPRTAAAARAMASASSGATVPLPSLRPSGFQTGTVVRPPSRTIASQAITGQAAGPSSILGGIQRGVSPGGIKYDIDTATGFGSYRTSTGRTITYEIDVGRL